MATSIGLAIFIPLALYSAVIAVSVGPGFMSATFTPVPENDSGLLWYSAQLTPLAK
jgi:hypothetical protein